MAAKTSGNFCGDKHDRTVSGSSKSNGECMLYKHNAVNNPVPNKKDKKGSK